MNMVDSVASVLRPREECTVPTVLPVATRALTHQVRESATPLVLSCAAVAAAATVLACFVGFTCRDITGAVLTLLTAFTFIELSLLVHPIWKDVANPSTTER